MMLARFSEAFLVLKAADTGLSIAWVPLVMVVMSLVYSLSSYPAGALSDRVGRTALLIAGLGCVLIAADLVLAFGGSVTSMMIGVALWGLHMGLTQGGLSTLVADTAPKPLRGTAFGVFNLASGLALLVGSVVAGLLWDVQRAVRHLPRGRRLRRGHAARPAVGEACASHSMNRVEASAATPAISSDTCGLTTPSSSAKSRGAAALRIRLGAEITPSTSP